MSHFLGTPSRARIWARAESKSSTDVRNLRKRLLSGPTVNFYVGAERRHWSLHANLLSYHSPYFESELRGHGVPRQEQSSSLDLPDDDPKGFELFVNWLYQGKLEDAHQSSDEQKYEHAVACHKLHNLCSKFDMVDLKDQAMDSYRKNLHEAQLVPDADEMNEIYRGSPSDSPFRKLMAHIAARQIMDPEVEKDAESYRCCFEGNADFAIEMVNAIRRLSGGMLLSDPTDGNQSAWQDATSHAGRSIANVKGRGDESARSESMGNGKMTVNENDFKNANKKRLHPQAPSEANLEIRSSQQLPVESQQREPEMKVLPLKTGTGAVSDSERLFAEAADPIRASIRSSVPRRRPRKLDKSPSKRSPERDATHGAPSMANGSRPLTYMRESPPHDEAGLGQAAAARSNDYTSPDDSTNDGEPPNSLRRLHGRRYVNGVVLRINGSNEAASESEAT